MARYFISLFATVAVIFACAWWWILNEPMSFLDHEYPNFRAKIEMAVQLPPGAVVILGDSRAFAGMIPARLGPDVYNLAFTGASPIEHLAIARLVLSGPNPPRAVILSSAPLQFITDSVFWENSARFGLLDYAAIEDARVRSRKYPNDLVLGPLGHPSLDPALRSLLFGPYTIGDVEGRLKTILYSIRFPSYYFASLEQGGIYQRGEGNWESYHQMFATRGQKTLWNANGCRDLSPETTASSFDPSPLLDGYLSETLDLFQKRNIPVYFIGSPLADVSITALHPGFADGFDRYIRNYEKAYPQFHCLGNTLPSLPWIYFGDPGHLNENGAKVFSDDVADLLRKAAVENKHSL